MVVDWSAKARGRAAAVVGYWVVRVVVEKVEGVREAVWVAAWAARVEVPAAELEAKEGRPLGKASRHPEAFLAA